ncbi:hotdog domain-containing protein [Raineyella fluvialis]|uniref:HotDog ACOT-type domain-containing protein n=1 Tax=Raineyella fluvialis TaxID=2662261 RepID=A0A5Q2FIZ5_9ACTN|nr:hotdog domain-containing protein [Raineyella fluvialis]QGF24625.1 hypothetical protein Rai3103_14395 [Raineyella fluvialis]
MSDPRIGLSVTHRRYVGHNHTHYSGSQVDHSYTMSLLSDAATEVCIRTDSDEGAVVAYDEIDFLAPIYAGDVLEVEAFVVGVGSTSRELGMEARVICREAQRLDETTTKLAPTASYVLEHPLVVARANATVVVANPLPEPPTPWGSQVAEVPDRPPLDAKAGLRDLQETWLRWTRDAREQIEKRAADLRSRAQSAVDHNEE